ncbi:MAG TPA: Ig-like domain-containing protein, partial [Chloroflexota bacterium]|nr:Ig-like domain-containing protein [Chloroflexota bacterium]
MPGSSKGSAAGGGHNRRLEGARPVKRTKRTRPAAATKRFGWSRRVGAALGLILLVGAGIAFASGALDRRDGAPDRPNGPLPSPPPALTLIAPETALTRLTTVDISGVLPPGVDHGAADGLRLFVNGRLERERAVPDGQTFTLRDVGLDEGENSIQAALFNAAGEGQLSAEISIVRDTTPPAIRISSPGADSTAYESSATLRGRTEPGASLEVQAERTGEKLDPNVGEDGIFETTLPLEMGNNTFTLRSVDAAGNRSSARLNVTRTIALSSITLSVSATELALRDLPETLEAVARVRNELGRASDGDEVTFSLSPPNRATSTYRTTTVNGQATWPNMIVTGDSRAVGT